MILAYHKVAPVANTQWWITVDRFYEQMHALCSRTVVHIDDYDPANDDHAVITFDGIYDNIYDYAFPILKYFGYPFELFVIGDYIGRENTFDQHVEPPCNFANDAMLREMCGAGGRLQWHTRSHRRLSELNGHDIVNELLPPSTLSEQFAAPNLRWFAYPHGDLNPEHRTAVEHHFTGALACDDGNPQDRFYLPRKLVFAETRLFRGTVAGIVVNYNYGRYLREAVDSLERQSSKPDEVLIIDDASTDDSETVLSELEEKGYRIVRNEKNLGIVENFRKAVSLTAADYVFFLGADNRLRSDYLMQCRTALDSDPSAAIVYSDMTIFGPLASRLAKAVGAEPVAAKNMESGTVYHWRFPKPEGDALEHFAERNFVHGSSMYRRSVYEQVGGYKASDGPEDHHLFYRMWKAGGGLSHVAKPLLEYRQHSPAQANTALSAALEIKALRRALAEKDLQIQNVRGALTESDLEIKALHTAIVEKDKATREALDELSALREEHLSRNAQMSALSSKLNELLELNERIRLSSLWPLIRIAKPLRKRLKRVAELTKRARAIISHEGLRLPMARSRSDLIDALPAIAQNFSDHGMRPGHWVAPEVTKSLQKQGFTVVANTFYAVTPDLNELGEPDWRPEKYAAAWRKVKVRPLDRMLSKFAAVLPELSDIPLTIPDEQGRFYWDNPMFSPLDAASYYGIIRALQPRRLIEVGSGYSTAIALEAAKRSVQPVDITCIEPYPSQFLLKQKSKLKDLIQRKVQDVDPMLFETLEPGDVLFIDSSHCTRISSDLNFLMFDAIPRLKVGVRVHFHDIFLPSEYPREWLEDVGIMWNEQYLVLAFLMFNEAFEVLWSSSIAAATRRQDIERMFTGVIPCGTSFLNNLGPYSGGSIWLEKTR